MCFCENAFDLTGPGNISKDAIARPLRLAISSTTQSAACVVRNWLLIPGSIWYMDPKFLFWRYPPGFHETSIA